MGRGALALQGVEHRGALFVHRNMEIKQISSDADFFYSQQRPFLSGK